MYPKKITLKDEKLKKLLTEKGELIKIGIKKSQDIESIEKEMEEVDLKIQEIEKTVDITDLTQKEADITYRVQECIAEMEEIKKEIFNRMKEKDFGVLHEKYEELKKDKETAETDRNKIAIKAQKYNDKIIPMGRKIMTPYLEDEYDDYDTIQLEEGEIVCSIFNHLNDFKTNYKK